jgi:transcriptional regulator with XRE-family HTH domain
MPKTKKHKAQPRKPGPHPVVGAELLETAKRRGYSRLKHARLAGISPRYLRVAYNGGNITLSVLKRAMAALEITHINLGNLTASGTLDGVNPAVVRRGLEQVEDGLTIALKGVSELRQHIDRVDEADAGDAAALIREVAAAAKKKREDATEPEGTVTAVTPKTE